MALRGKRALFPAEYIKDRNATQAAIRCGYVAASAGTTGDRLLQNEDIRSEIMLLGKEASQTSGVDAAWLLTRLAEVADVKIEDLFDENGAMKDPKDFPDGASRLVSGIKTKEITNMDGDLIGYTREIKMEHRSPYLKMIGQHIDVGALVTKLDAKVQIEHKFNVRDFTTTGEINGDQEDREQGQVIEAESVRIETQELSAGSEARTETPTSIPIDAIDRGSIPVAVSRES